MANSKFKIAKLELKEEAFVAYSL